MATTAQYPRSDTGSGKVTVYAESPSRGRRLTARCHEHGERLTELEDVSFTVDRGGMTYRLSEPSETRLAYCRECVAYLRHRHHDFQDLSDREIVIRQIEQNFYANPATGRGGFRELFDAAVAVIGDTGLSHCPACGTELGMVNRETGRCTCPEHGDMTVQIRFHDL